MTALTHPLQQWPRDRRRLVLACLVVAALLPLVLGALVNPLLEDEPGGEDIVAFELAGSVGRGQEILATWRAEGVIDDRRGEGDPGLRPPLSVHLRGRARGWLYAAAGGWQRLGRERFAAAGIAVAWVADRCSDDHRSRESPRA